MLKRIFIIAFLTGVGQLAMIFSIKSIAKFLNSEQLASIAKVDSLVVLITNIIAFGLQSASMRNIVIAKDWKAEYNNVQSARITLGFILFVFGFFGYFKWEYFTFFLAPLLALSGDFALYALGKSILGAFYAFIRVLVPYISLLVTGYFRSDWAGFVFLGSWFFIYFISDKLIANHLAVSFCSSFNWRSLKLYFYSLPLGIAIVSLYFLGIGSVLIVSYYYSSPITAVAFIGLKFYTVFKGVLRILSQSFLREMVDEKLCLKVDNLSILVALVYLASFVCFPYSTISIFFGKQYFEHKTFFTLLGFGAVVYSFFSSAAIKALFEKKDIPYSIVTFIAALITLCLIIIASLFSDSTSNIGVAIVIGEIASLIGLIYISSSKKSLMPRLLFVLKNLIPFVIPGVSIFFLNDTPVHYLLMFAIVGLWLLFCNYKRFKSI